MSDEGSDSRIAHADEKRPRRSERPGRSARTFNVPNILCLIRLAGSAVLLVIAWTGYSSVFLGLYATLLLTDWLDGKLARRLRQRSSFGARLDSLADAALYTALAIGMWWLRPQTVRTLAVWLAAVGVGYAVSVVLSLVKFRRPPSFHAYSAKLAWFSVNIAVAIMLLGGPVWPLRAALGLVVAANLEAAAITLTLREYATDVPSILHALRRTSADD